MFIVGTFRGLGHFEAWDVLGRDIFRLGTFWSWDVLYGVFVLGRFVLGCFVGVPLEQPLSPVLAAGWFAGAVYFSGP